MGSVSWLVWGVVVCQVCIIIALSVKVYLMRKAAGELREGSVRILETETNTLLTISSHDGEMKRLAAALNVELRELRGQRHRFEQGDLKLKEAVANISHDIRTPLTALCGYLDLAKQLLAQMPVQEDTETLQRYLGIMENRAVVLTQLTEELFRYAVVMSEIPHVIYEGVILNHLLEETISIYYGVLRENKITPVIYMPEKGIKSGLNKNILSRIIGNIIGNAIKYSDGDLQITLSERGEMVFSNHASGLDEVQAGKLFERFYTVHTGRKSTGLGLSIAKQLTEQMGGTIDAGYRDGVLSISLFFPIIPE